MPTPLQGYIGSLQGSGSSLQGSSPLNLQGSAPKIQGPTQSPKKQTYGNTAATSPAKKQYIDSLKAYKYADDPTVYGNYKGNSDYAFTSEQEFKNAGGSFANVETRMRPQSPTTSFNGNNSSGSQTPTQQPATPSPLEKARADYLATLTPDSSVTAAKQKYMDFVSSAESGIAAREGQGRGIPLELVRGQQKRLSDQAEITAKRMQGDIDLAQGDQALGQSKAKAALDFATTDATNNKPLELASGSTLVKLNPTTGKYEQVGQGLPKAEDLPASAKEYEYAKKNGYTGTYEQYQNDDANRKRAVTNIINGSGLSGPQASLFSGIVDKYNKSPLIAAADRAVNLKNTIKNVKANPNDGAQQLNMVYQYIGALDNYQTGVKEGELQLVGSLQSKIGAVQKAVEGIANSNKPVDAKTALQIAEAAELLTNSIDQAAAQKAKSYQSQANTLGLGQAWNSYIGGFTPTYSSGNQNNSTTGDVPDYGSLYGF